ncbi:MAG: hypothetical protein AAF206_10490 [Bacteroidota bacterium]
MRISSLFLVLGLFLFMGMSNEGCEETIDELEDLVSSDVPLIYEGGELLLDNSGESLHIEVDLDASISAADYLTQGTIIIFPGKVPPCPEPPDDKPLPLAAGRGKGGTKCVPDTDLALEVVVLIDLEEAQIAGLSEPSVANLREVFADQIQEKYSNEEGAFTYAEPDADGFVTIVPLEGSMVAAVFYRNSIALELRPITLNNEPVLED